MPPARADREPAKRLMLRSSSAASGALALAIAALGFCPGYERLRLGELEEVATVASSPLGLAVVLGILGALLAYVWRRPLLANALLASMVSVGTSVFVLALMAPPAREAGDQVIVQPAAALAGQLVLALVVLQIVLVPVACGLFARAVREPRPDRIARARVHRLGRG